ncbi:MAG: hypothetical protein Q9180_000699 [Flavoplaca navasiana]
MASWYLNLSVHGYPSRYRRSFDPIRHLQCIVPGPSPAYPELAGIDSRQQASMSTCHADRAIQRAFVSQRQCTRVLEKFDEAWDLLRNEETTKKTKDDLKNHPLYVGTIHLQRCEPCKRKNQKCDRKVPGPCGNCTRKRWENEYFYPVLEAAAQAITTVHDSATPIASTGNEPLLPEASSTPAARIPVVPVDANSLPEGPSVVIGDVDGKAPPHVKHGSESSTAKALVGEKRAREDDDVDLSVAQKKPCQAHRKRYLRRVMYDQQAAY